MISSPAVCGLGGSATGVAASKFAAVIGALRDAFPGTEFRHAGLAEFVAAVRAEGRAMRRHRGELRGGKDQFILPGVWSARTYLKQANDEAQTLLERYLEPVLSDAHFRLGAGKLVSRRD